MRFADDDAALRHVLGELRPGHCVDVWRGSHHVAKLWGEAAAFPAALQPRPTLADAHGRSFSGPFPADAPEVTAKAGGAAHALG